LKIWSAYAFSLSGGGGNEKIDYFHERIQDQTGEKSEDAGLLREKKGIKMGLPKRTKRGSLRESG